MNKLQLAAKSHTEHTGHTDLVFGRNYVQCRECDLKGQIGLYGLLVSSPNSRNLYTVSPDKFYWTDNMTETEASSRKKDRPAYPVSWRKPWTVD